MHKYKCKHKRHHSEILQSPNFLSVFTFNFHDLPFKANHIYSLTLGPRPLILRPDLVITSLVRFGREFAMGLEYNYKLRTGEENIQITQQKHFIHICTTSDPPPYYWTKYQHITFYLSLSLSLSRSLSLSFPESSFCLSFPCSSSLSFWGLRLIRKRFSGMGGTSSGRMVDMGSGSASSSSDLQKKHVKIITFLKIDDIKNHFHGLYNNKKNAWFCPILSDIVMLWIHFNCTHFKNAYVW